MPAPSFSRATAIQGMRTHESIERLRYNLKEEHMLKMDWVMTLFKHTLVPAQVARMLVQVRFQSLLLTFKDEHVSQGLAGVCQKQRSQPPLSSSQLGTMVLG